MKKVIKIVSLAIVGLVVIGTFYMLWAKSRPVETRYEHMTVTKGDLVNTSIATGKVAPRNEVLIKPQVSGIISEIRKEAGDFVKTGEIIATIQIIPEMSALNAAEARVRMVKIDLDQEKQVLERQRNLYGKKVISREEMERSEVAFKKIKEEYETSLDNLDIIRKGISQKMKSMSNTQIRSTVDGMILDIPVKVGNSVIQSNTFNDGTTIAAVANMNDLTFIGKIDETEVGRVHVGMPVKLTIGAIRDHEFDAELEYISPKGREENGAILFEIKAAVSIPDSIPVRAGYSANAKIVLESASDVLLVPENTVFFNGDQTFVYLLRESVAQKIEYVKQEVKIGLSDGIKTEIVSGLQAGQQVRGNEMIEN